MATLNELVGEQAKLIDEAKRSLEAAQKKPPAGTTPTAANEVLLADLKERTTNLTKARDDIAEQITKQIATYKTEIATLEKQIEEDKKRFGDQPPPRLTPRRSGGKK